MVQLSNTLFLAFTVIAVHVHARPLVKRIAQTISDSTTKWEASCDSAGGGAQCNTLAVNAFETLLIGADVCAQQNAADTMITLAKQLNSTTMITLAQVFAQQPRNTPNSQAVPYCQVAPNNTELSGYYQCQFEGASETTFVGSLSVGSAGTLPFGQTTVVSPAGSCPAHTSAPIPDGEQLVSITTNPGTPATGNGKGNNTASATSNSASSVSVSAATQVAGTSASTASAASATGSTDSSSCNVDTSAVTPSDIATATASATSSGSTSSVLLSNGQEAQRQNAEFASLTASSTCTEGTDACVGGEFAQCVDGAYVTTSCGSSLSCFALPLVNSAGTAITCTTQSDATSRIASTGTTGGVTGSD